VKNSLRLIVTLSLCWIIVLVLLRSVAGPLLLDFILPPRVLTATTPVERQEIAERLRESSNPSVLLWILPVAILLLGIYALRTENKRR